MPFYKGRHPTRGLWILTGDLCVFAVFAFFGGHTASNYVGETILLSVFFRGSLFT